VILLCTFHISLVHYALKILFNYKIIIDIFFRHIAARQDQYAVSVLLLARGAKIGEVNAIGETAVNCCVSDGDTMAALRLNAKVNELSEHMWEKTVKILTK